MKKKKHFYSHVLELRVQSYKDLFLSQTAKEQALDPSLLHIATKLNGLNGKLPAGFLHFFAVLS